MNPIGPGTCLPSIQTGSQAWKDSNPPPRYRRHLPITAYKIINYTFPPRQTLATIPSPPVLGYHIRPSSTPFDTFILEQSSHPLSAPEFQFQWKQQAAVHNWEILQSYGLDLKQALSHKSQYTSCIWLRMPTRGNIGSSIQPSPFVGTSDHMAHSRSGIPSPSNLRHTTSD